MRKEAPWSAESPQFRLFGCEHGCFHLEWKYFGIVHMTVSHLASVHSQLKEWCTDKDREGIDCAANRFLWLECNEDVKIRLMYQEAVALLSEVGSLLRTPSYLDAGLRVGYVM